MRSQLEAPLDLVIQVARRPDGSRRVVAVAEVLEGGDATEGGARTRLVADGAGIVADGAGTDGTGGAGTGGTGRRPAGAGGGRGPAGGRTGRAAARTGG